MIEYVISLSLSLMTGPACPSGCPVLTGKDTPLGVHTARQMDYMGIGFKEDGKGGMFAIHPVWTDERQRKLSGEKRNFVTAGCINVDYNTFIKLPKRSFRLRIEK